MKNLVKLALLLLIWMASIFSLTAAPITQQQAQQNVQTFLESKGLATKASTLRLTQPKFTSTNEKYYYVFNIGDNDGYVVAAGDDCAPAILGYSDSGSVDLDSLPVNMKSWLEEYAQQIEYMQEHQLVASPKLTTSYNAISPLMTTTWDQQAPYNQFCPDFFSYGKSVTGCVATAMAQVMYYHRANSVTQTTAQIPAYDCSTLWLNGSDTLGHIHVDAIPAGSPIDWGNMLESYGSSATAIQKEAVANLMKYCGASVKMNYANAWNGGSGAYDSDVPIALKNYFNYSSETTLKYRINYSTNDWEYLIYNELSNSRPVYYRGSNSSSGHAFVCDGYDGSGYYHINWGWSGTSDGYFLLTALDPNQQGAGGSSSGYNSNQAALINAQPKTIYATSISLNQTSAEITEGNTLQLVATVLPTNATNKMVTWKSSNTSIATVNSNGLVTALAPGTATITATTTDGTNLSATCSLLVKQSVIYATSISLNKTSATITEGNTTQLTATVLPTNATNRTVTWSTSNSSVATVNSNGLVTAINSGSVTITATTADGTNLSATCAVTVQPSVIYATSISLNKTSASITEGNTLQLSATVLPTNATNRSVTWKSSNTSVATVNSNGLVTAKSSGSATITATTTDGTNLSATCAVTVNAQTLSNYFAIPDTTVQHGEIVVIPVRLNNEDEILSFQTDLFLPEDFNLVVDEDDEYMVTPSGRLSSDHILMAQSMSNGAVRVLCYSPNGTPIMGNEGDLFYLHIQVPEDAGGDYALNLRNSLLMLSDYNELSIPDATAVLTVITYIPGDVNDSHIVTVTDIVVTAQYIMEMNPSPFVFAAADMNGDGNVTVTDLMLIAYVVNHPSLTAPRRMPVLTAGSDRMSADGLNLIAGETRAVSIALDNVMNYSAFQLDLMLPDGLTASNFALTDRAGSHALDVNALANGKTRVLCYSPAIAAIEGDSGALLTFDVTANAAVDAQIAVDGIELVTTDCRTVLLDSFTIGVNNATGVNVLDGSKTVSRVDYYNLAGQRVERPESGVTLKVTTYTDGTRTTTKVIQ